MSSGSDRHTGETAALPAAPAGTRFVSATPRAELAGAVAGRIVGYEETGGEPIGETHLPAAIVPVIITFGGGWDVAAGEAAPRVRHSSFTAGLTLSPAGTVSDGRARCVQVNLTPLAARSVLGLPLSEIAGRVVALDDVLGAKVSELEERLDAATGWPARLRLVEDVLLERVRSAPPACARASHAWNAILCSAGRRSMSSIAAELGLTAKALIRLFRDQIGITPKAAARLVRFEAALGLLQESAAGEGAGVAAEAGFADQAHFIREFAAFAGATPDAYLRAVRANIFNRTGEIRS